MRPMFVVRLDIEAGIDFRWQIYRRGACHRLRKMRTRRLDQRQVSGCLVDVDPIPGEQFAHVAPVNNAERVQAEDAGYDPFVSMSDSLLKGTTEIVVLCFAAIRRLAASTSRIVNPNSSRSARSFCPAVVNSMPPLLVRSPGAKALTIALPKSCTPFRYMCERDFSNGLVGAA